MQCVDMGIHNRLLALSYVAGRLLVGYICLHPALCLEDTGSPPHTGGCRWGWGCHRWADRQSHTPCTPGLPLGTLVLLDWSYLCIQYIKGSDITTVAIHDGKSYF